MEEERLTALLHGLPRERALPGFTARVLRRLDEQPHPRRLAPRAGRPPGLLPWHRWMAATATVAALAVSVSLSQHDRAPGPYTATSQPRPVQLTGLDRLARTARIAQVSALAPSRRLPPPLSAEPGALRPRGDEMSPQTEQELHQLRAGQVRLERELRSLRQPMPRLAASPPSVIVLGGDEALDPALNAGRARAVQVTPPADRDDGEYNYSFL